MSGGNATRLLSIAVAWHLCSPPATANSVEDGKLALERQDYVLAHRMFAEAAHAGDPEGAFNLGHDFHMGSGVKGSIPDAILWFRTAAEKGHVQAMIRLSEIYERADGKPPNNAMAIHWLHKAAQHGEPFALTKLAGLFRYGNEGVPKNPQLAFKLNLRSAEAGERVGMQAVAAQYQFGQGVPQNYVRAHMWYNLLAAMPAPKHSDGVLKDFLDASSDSFRQGHEDSRNKLARMMTVEQIAEAQDLASRWVPSPDNLVDADLKAALDEAFPED